MITGWAVPSLDPPRDDGAVHLPPRAWQVGKVRPYRYDRYLL